LAYIARPCLKKNKKQKTVSKWWEAEAKALRHHTPYCSRVSVKAVTPHSCWFSPLICQLFFPQDLAEVRFAGYLCLVVLSSSLFSLLALPGRRSGCRLLQKAGTPVWRRTWAHSSLYGFHVPQSPMGLVMGWAES
jgi:hypothetical protein